MEFEGGLLWGLVIGMVFIGCTSYLSPDKFAEQLADAICEEKYGTEFDHYEYTGVGEQTISGIVCKSPIIEEEIYDGLIIKVGD